MELKKLQILFIAKNIPIQGIHSTKVVIKIAHQLSSFCNIVFLYPKERIPFGLHLIKKYRPFYKLKLWHYDGFEIYITKYIRLPFRNMAFWLLNSLSKKDIAYYNENGPFDLIHAHYLFPDGYFALLYSKKFNIPYIVTIRNADIKHLKCISKNNPDFKKAKTIIQNAQKVLSLNLAYKFVIDKMFSINSLIVPHGIEQSYFTKSPIKKSNKVIITTVSEAIKRKNIDWIIKAVMNYSGNADICLKVIGKGPLLDILKHQARNDKRIQFLGKIDRNEVLAFLENSDIFALPSYDESFGLVYLEAAATKNAIIGLKDEGVWGIFIEGEEMLFCNNETHFNEIFHELINNENLRSRLKRAAYTKAKKLSWENIAQQYKKVYTESIASFREKST